MARKPKPDLDERFSLLGEDPDEVARKLVKTKKHKDSGKPEGPKQPPSQS